MVCKMLRKELRVLENSFEQTKDMFLLEDMSHTCSASKTNRCEKKERSGY